MFVKYNLRINYNMHIKMLQSCMEWYDVYWLFTVPLIER